MKVSVILAHPNPQSFNHAIAQSALSCLTRNGHEAYSHDLYGEIFDPVLPYSEFSEGAPLPDILRKRSDEIQESDGIVAVHPNWWGQPPGILKGWMDRVLRPGIAFRFLDGDEGEGVPKGLLRARAAIVFNTSNTPAAREAEIFGDPLEKLWRDCVFGLCGVDFFFRRTFRTIVTSSEVQRRQWLQDVDDIIAEYFPRLK
jgi:NAD(P)H dehydrogenase (quinone)